MTKIQFWKQFTTCLRMELYTLRCIQYDKDTILKAIYNFLPSLELCTLAVFSMTKIQFWKQFTTRITFVCNTTKLYSVWQRYNFESNLQPFFILRPPTRCCIQYDKDTILKAIYNTQRAARGARRLYSVWQRYNFESNLQHLPLQCPQPFAVFSMTKIQFWKQFTTAPVQRGGKFLLYSVWQRYNFESNLQRLRRPHSQYCCCIQYDKDTILKAIYNVVPLGTLDFMLYSVWQRYNFESNLQPSSKFNVFILAVFSMTKIQFWKQFTTARKRHHARVGLYSVWQRYNFESNLQQKTKAYVSPCAVFSMTKIQFWKQFTTLLRNRLCLLCCIQYDKDTILKAIYNEEQKKLLIRYAVFSMTKIQFWKQFTTTSCATPFASLLYSVWQRYNFESNLQPREFKVNRIPRCIQYDKDTILKAIYNEEQKKLLIRYAVFSMTKIQFWKQFTTAQHDIILPECCIQYDKDTILKAIYN